MDSPTFSGVTEVNGSFFLSCLSGSVYEIGLETDVLAQCGIMEDGSVSVPPQIADSVMLKRFFQVKNFKNMSSVVLTEQDIVCCHDKQLSFGRDRVKVNFSEYFEGVKKMFDLEEVM